MRTHQEIVDEIEKVLKDKVAPSVAAHNGKIKFISFLIKLVLTLTTRGVEN